MVKKEECLREMCSFLVPSGEPLDITGRTLPSGYRVYKMTDGSQVVGPTEDLQLRDLKLAFSAVPSDTDFGKAEFELLAAIMRVSFAAARRNTDYPSESVVCQEIAAFSRLNDLASESGVFIEEEQ